MKKSVFSILLSIALGGALQAATINVGPGQSIQAAVNGASNGDEILLTSPGQYNGNVAIAGKSLHLRATNSQVTSILGNLSVSNLPAAGKVRLENFSIAGSVTATGAGKLSLLKMLVETNVDLNGTTDCFLRRTTVTGTVSLHNAQDANGNPTRLVVLQSTIKEKLTSRATKAWIGYSTLEETYLEGTLEIVGNVFNGRDGGGIGIDLNGANTVANIHNNQIFDFGLNQSGDLVETCIGIRVDGGAKADIVNNHIKDCRDYRPQESETFVGMGVYVKSTTGAKIIGNLLHSNYVSGGATTGHANVWAPAQNVTVAYNGMTSSYGSALVAGGASNNAHVDDSSSVSNKFLSDPSGYMYNKQGKDKGPPDAISQDHDGSRNDIGPNGGRNYIPNGRTTDKPIPISFTVAPLQVPLGGTITIESTGATVK